MPSAASVKKKNRRQKIIIFESDGFQHLGVAFKPKNVFVKPFAAMATIPHDLIPAKRHPKKSGPDAALPKPDSTYVAMRKRGKRRRRRVRRLKKRRR